MAHGVNESPKLTIHQALHGYSDGHQQLALSARLKPRDLRTLLVLSDISGPGVVLSEQGYMTGYPLSQSGFFAVSRTWPATEMPRPGCVWTHTLLIHFDDLATLNSLSSLSSLFARPKDLQSYESYGLPLYVAPATDSDSEAPSSAITWARSLVSALYARPNDLVIAKWPGNWVDDVVLAIWSQQWPRLRRNFRFCTLTASDRSTEGSRFDLQVLPSNKSNVRARFPGAIDAEQLTPDGPSWLEYVLEDLMRPDQSGLRSFLRRTGPDVAGGREVFFTLCQLHYLFQAPSNDPKSVQAAIALLQKEPLLKKARTAKTYAANRAIETLKTLDALSFQFLWENLDLIDIDTFWLRAPEIGQIVLQRNPQLLASLQDFSSSERVVLERTLDTLEIDSLITGVEVAPQLIEMALERRPELAGEQRLWSNVKLDEAMFKAVAKAGLQSRAVLALLHSRRTDLIDTATRLFGARAILEVLSCDSDTELSVLHSWTRASASNIEAVTSFLTSKIQIPQRVLLSIALALHPRSVPNVQGSDPWLTAWRNSVIPINASEQIYLFSFFIHRALEGSSQSPAEMLQLSFEPVHEALATDSLPDQSWDMIESCLPFGLLRFSRGRRKRLRAAVADIFVERTLSSACFARLTLDKGIFYKLVKYVSQTVKGRAYLEKVLQDLIVTGSLGLEAHCYVIEQSLNGHK